MKKTSAIFLLKDEKKHSVRYLEETSPLKVASTIYFSKNLLGDERPEKIKVTVEEVE